MSVPPKPPVRPGAPPANEDPLARARREKDELQGEVQTLEEELFVLMTMGSDRNVVATYVMGKRAGV